MFNERFMIEPDELLFQYGMIILKNQTTKNISRSETAIQ